MHQTNNIMVCSPFTGGCGHFGLESEWKESGMDKQCPNCGLEHGVRVTHDNLKDIHKLGVDPEPIRELFEAHNPDPFDPDTWADDALDQDLRENGTDE